MTLDSGARLAAGVVFSVLLAAAAITDARSRRIPNRLALAIALVGASLSIGLTLTGHSGAWLPSPGRSVAGLAVGFALWLPLHVIGALGAGDVKLAAASGTWLGPGGVLVAALIAAIAGGVLALAMMIRSRTSRAVLANLWLRLASWRGGSSPLTIASSRNLLPYGVAISFGAAAAFWRP